MNTKIWLEELSFGSNFENLRAIASNRCWCYFLVHTFKIKKFESISSNGSRNIAKWLKISFGSSSVSLRAFGSTFWHSRHIYLYIPFKQKKPRSIIFTRSWVWVYITFAHGRTDSLFWKIKNIYTCLYLSRLFFKLNFEPSIIKSNKIGNRYS